jgi:hypothetical protein
MMFPMCSSTRSCLILLTGAVGSAALASCGGQTVNRAADDNRVQVSSRAAPPAVVRPKAALAAPPTALSTDSLHFDLYCQLHGHVLSDPHPEEIIGTYPDNARTWRDADHLIVDLQAMQVCDSSACERHGPFQIGATSDRITLQDVPGASIFISRRNWRYEQRQEEMGRVSVTRGQCRRASFSGFPTRTSGQ